MLHCLRVVAMFLSAALAACANSNTNAPPAAPQPGRSSEARVPVGEEFKLRNGGSATITSTGLTVRFDRVDRDDRCPVGAQCVQEGDAVVLVEVRESEQAAAVLELHTEAGKENERPYRNYRVRLVRLDPRPVGEQHTPLPQYTATFVLFER